MRHFLLSLPAFLLCVPVSAQTSTPNKTLNLSFEKKDKEGRITGINSSFGRDNYYSYADDSIKIDGQTSLRMQKDTGSNTGGFGVVSFTLPANFKGNELLLKGYIRTENVQGGYAGLWLRTDAGSEMVFLDNMNQHGVMGSTGWMPYSIRAPLSGNITSLVFGGIMTGKGKAWFDKLELLVDGTPVESVAWVPPVNLPHWKELGASGVIVDSLLSKQQVKNLFVLGKTWGFLKYHHPSVAKSTYNFDSCLFSIMPAVIKAGDDTGRDDLLLNWINTLGDEKKFSLAKALDTTGAHTRPALQWLDDDKLLSARLAERLKEIYKYRNSGTNYYISFVPNVGNPVFDKEARYRDAPANDDGLRMLALFRYWNMIEYFFPYKHLLKENWNNTLEEFIPQFASNRSALDYRLTSLRLINEVHDTHANIYGDPVLLEYFGKNAPVLDFKMLDNKVIVSGFINDSLASFETLRPGDEILTVNGKKIAEKRSAADPYICASNSSVADRNFLDRFLFKSNDDSLQVTFSRDGKTKKAVMRLYPPARIIYRNGDSWRRPMYELVDPEIGYINLGNIKADSLGNIFKKFENTKGLIIDIRNYPNEFMPFAMGQYLKHSSTPFVKFTTGDLKNPGLFSFSNSISNGPVSGKSKQKTYRGYVVILVNEQSQSQAEYTAMALRSTAGSVVMGSQTAGADGNISYVPFPGGFSSPFSGIGVFYPTGQETQGVGIIPDITVLPTRKGIKEGKDEVLEKAMEQIKKTKGF